MILGAGGLYPPDEYPGLTRNESGPNRARLQVLTRQALNLSGRTHGNRFAVTSRRSPQGERGFLTRYPIAFCRFSSSFARNACVFIHGASGAISTDRSRVMYPASTVSTHTFSSVSANFVTSGVLSNRPR